MKILKLIVQPRIIDHLGIKMYQKPVDVISEFIANSWDADAEIVNIKIGQDHIEIEDDGVGMTFDECQNFYLTVGRDRRKDTGKEVSTEKKRPVLGRKGIGKFAGFGIAQKINIKTTAKETCERTEFEMDISSILEHDLRNENEKKITVIENSINTQYQPGTKVNLLGIQDLVTNFNIDEFKSELARRFLLSQFYDDFSILVNGEILPESFSDEMEFVFPRDLTEEEKLKFPQVTSFDKAGWANELFLGKEVQWRIGFYENTIKIEELRGISIFAKGKLAQKPFFFDLSGGISGQNSLEYLSGQIRMDFIDEGNNDLISTERQRINLQGQNGKLIKEWGIEKIKIFGDIWKKRRSQKRLDELNNKISGFRDRLNNLPPTERKTVESVLRKIANFPRLGQARFHDWCNDILTSWEIGRLRNLITEISESEDLDENRFIEILSEADILTALNIAESIKTKIYTISELKKRVIDGELENAVRDFIFKHPWLIHPQWDSFKKERSVKKLIEDIAQKELNIDAFNGRVDLALSSGSNLLLVEFIRPGIPLDKDHLDRINYYVLGIRRALKRETGAVIKNLDTAYIIADTERKSEDYLDRVHQLKDESIFVLTWNSLIENSIKQWEEHLELIKQRNPNDKRIQDL